MTNKEIRAAIEASGVKYWQVAAKLGISDGNFSRKLRHELPQAEEDRVLAAIAAVKAEEAGAADE